MHHEKFREIDFTKNLAQIRIKFSQCVFFTCPPQRSLVVVTTSSRCQDAMGLIAQHMVTMSACSDPSGFWSAQRLLT